MGRFINRYPVGLPGGDNPYRYASNPIGWIDSWGWCVTPAGSRGAAGQPLHATATTTVKDLGTGTVTKVYKNGQQIMGDNIFQKIKVEDDG
ncbi:hypothetical protein [Burkholderia lata]|uniref:hypothetical protein n=1 Tax=Burkholderia lata (strain ATCC 17760 / DSM 23089 / LMG 22485 / NCIMB 9086 / R18194 / 383) TaxID=482957 RepID=UPI0015833280|nr:hypothetical protein [Burkholderia lata]